RCTAPRPQLRWGADVVRQTAEWYGSAEARAMADSVLHYQSAAGAWPKNTDLTIALPSAAYLADANALTNTIDNEATTLPMRFLALMVRATGEVRYRSAF